MTSDEVDRTIARVLGVSLGLIGPTQRLKEDLGATPQTLHALSRELGIGPAEWLEDDAWETWQTVADIHRTVSRAP